MTDDASTSHTAGRCLCGSVRFAFDGPPRWVVHCHCESCRRQCSAPYTTFVGVADGAWRWTGDEPGLYRSSQGVRRRFCTTCGTPMAYEADHWPGEIHFYAASLDDPNAVQPTGHVFFHERLAWVHLSDTLPRHEGPAA